MCLGGRCSAGRKGEQGGAIQLQDNYAQDPGYQKRRKMLQARGGRPQVFLRQTLQGARVGVTLGHSLNGHRHCVLSVSCSSQRGLGPRKVAGPTTRPILIVTLRRFAPILFVTRARVLIETSRRHAQRRARGLPICSAQMRSLRAWPIVLAWIKQSHIPAPHRWGSSSPRPHPGRCRVRPLRQCALCQ